MTQEASPDIASSTEGYAARFAGPVGQYLLQVQEQAVLEMLDRGPKSGRVLEVGGGHCQLFIADGRAGNITEVFGDKPGTEIRRDKLRVPEQVHQ